MMHDNIIFSVICDMYEYCQRPYMGVGCQMLRFLQLFLFSSPFPASRLKNPFTVSFRVACGCLLCALFSLNLKKRFHISRGSTNLTSSASQFRRAVHQCGVPSRATSRWTLPRTRWRDRSRRPSVALGSFPGLPCFPPEQITNKTFPVWCDGATCTR